MDVQGTSLGPRESMGSTVVNGIMYIFGGNTNEHSNKNDEYTDDLCSISIKNSLATCKKLITDGPVPPKRLSNSLSNLNNEYLILFGGESHNSALNDLWSYKIDRNCWNEIKPFNSISARMAHVCYCFKDSVIVIGGMSEDHITKSDLAVLTFGNIKINLTNGSGINPKRKITKILSVTSRTAPLISNIRPKNQNIACFRCGHSSSTCKFSESFPDLAYPNFHFFPKVNISTSTIKELVSEFDDPFGAILTIGNILESPGVSLEITGVVNIKENQVCKIMPVETPKDLSFLPIDPEDNGFRLRQKLLNELKSVPTNPTNILKIYSELGFTPSKVANICSSNSSFVAACLKLSYTAILISKTNENLTVALIHWTDLYIPLFFAVFDKNGESVYPCKDLFYPNMVNVYSRSHLQSADVFRHPVGTTIYVYPKQLVSKQGDLVYYKHSSSNVYSEHSLSKLFSLVNHVKYSINGRVIEKMNIEKEKLVDLGENSVYRACANGFSYLGYSKKKLVYWEYNKDYENLANKECVVFKIKDEEFISRTTGLLALKIKKVMDFFSLIKLNIK